MRRSCKTCGEPSWSPHSPLCLVHRPDEATRQAQAAKGGRAKGGYGQRHKRERARHARLVRAGLAFCVRCHDAILPDEPWDLDHTEDRRGWAGPAHACCNRRAGQARSRHASRSTVRLWSRVWFEPIPPDVVVMQQEEPRGGHGRVLR